MFLDGYIGAPPTVTVFSFISAEAEPMPPRLIASAAAAKPASAMVVMRFMAVTPLLCDAPDRGDFGATQPAQPQMRGHRDVSLPDAITGPVGSPVVEPPGGSSETANTALSFANAASSGDRVSVTRWSGRSKPTDRGLPSGGMSHSSGTRVASALDRQR